MHLIIFFSERCQSILIARKFRLAEINRIISPPILQSIDLFEKRMIPCDVRKEWQDQLEMF